jgi:hypothetical protein
VPRHQSNKTNSRRSSRGSAESDFNEVAADRVCAFFEGMLRHSKGELAGQPFMLMDWQRKMLREVFGRQSATGVRRYRSAYIELPKKQGKALALDTAVLTTSGWKTVGTLSVGDMVFHPDGHPIMVMAKSEVWTDEPCYRVRFRHSSESIVASGNHLWETDELYTQRRQLRTTEQIASTLLWKQGSRHSVRVGEAFQMPPADLPIDPYLLGCWLGDGYSADCRITVGDSDFRETLAELSPIVDVSTAKYISHPSVSVLRPRGGTRTKLRLCGLLNNKHIPPAYQFASVSQRSSLLEGLMDTDGHVSRSGQCELTLCNPRLASDAAQLIRGLGFKARMSASDATLRGRVVGTRYRIRFTPSWPARVFRLKRKQARARRPIHKKRRTKSWHICECSRCDTVPTQCIKVDSPDGLFVVGRDFVTTHNSTTLAGIALYMILADGEQGAEVYGAASDREQAGIIYREAAAMVRASPALSRHLDVIDSRKTILHKASNSFYRVLSADAFRAEGLNIHALLFDELHAQRDRRLWAFAPG